MSLAEDVENLYDDFEDNYIDDEEIYKNYLLGKLDWTTKENTKIRVNTMTNVHIQNCLKHNFGETWRIIFEFELKFRNLSKIII